MGMILLNLAAFLVNAGVAAVNVANGRYDLLVINVAFGLLSLFMVAVLVLEDHR